MNPTFADDPEAAGSERATITLVCVHSGASEIPNRVAQRCELRESTSAVDSEGRGEPSALRRRDRHSQSCQIWRTAYSERLERVSRHLCDLRWRFA